MKRLLSISAVLVAVMPLAASTRPPAEPLPETGTFSILGFDPDTGEIGAAVQSRVFSVGNGVIYAEAGVGAVATQAVIDVAYGPKGMALLRQGLAPKAIIARLLAEDTDPGYRGQPWPKAGRQMAVMNAAGQFAAYTGPDAPLKRGDAQTAHATAQGNTLGPVDPPGTTPPVATTPVPKAMVDAFEASATSATGAKNHISLRLVAALEAGQAAGGDNRGQQSAALIVVKKDCGVWLHNDVELHLQVDDNPAPIAELRRLVEKALAPSGQVPCFKR